MTGITKVRHAAFSLIELLVVVSILAILAGLLLPAIGMIRGSARAAGCLSHLRQLGLGVSAYATDNNGLLPLGSTLTGTTWTDTVLSTLEIDASSGILRCPAAKVPGGDLHYSVHHGLFAIEARIPVAPASTAGGWRAKVGSTRELRTDGVVAFDAQQSFSNGNANVFPFDQEAMWDWYSGGTDDRAALTNLTNTDGSGTGGRRARYRHHGDAAGMLWGDMRVTSSQLKSMTRGNFRCAKNGRKQVWEPK